MRQLKKVFSVLLALVILLGISPQVALPIAGASDVVMSARTSGTFTDVGGHWAAGSINRWNNFGFIDHSVFTGSQFLPDQHITRVEFFSLLVRTLGATSLADVTRFTDVTDLPENLRNIVAAANQMGIAQGRPDGTMAPHGTLLRQDAATLAARALGMSLDADWTLSRFSDASFIAGYARTHVAALVDPAHDGDDFADISRGELAAVVGAF